MAAARNDELSKCLGLPRMHLVGLNFLYNLGVMVVAAVS
jgi:hypothetical protein